MAQTQIRGSTQIIDGTITAAKFATTLNLTTAQLLEGADFIKRTGTVAFTANQSMGGFLLTNVADAVASTDGVNLRTAQALINGIAIKGSVRAVGVANVALTGTQTIDGVALVASDRVLLKTQTTTSQNGLWVVSAAAWTRPTDYAAASTQKSGILVIVTEGTVYQDTKWLSITDGNITVDTTATTWNQDVSGASYTNGNGLSLTGSTFAVKVGNGVAFDGTQQLTLTPNGTSLNVAAGGIKISDGTPGQVMIGTTTTGAALFTALTGDVSVTGAGVTAVNNTAGTGFIKYTNFVFNEIPTGLVNGVNTAFTLAFTPQNSSLQLSVNGQLLESGAGNDYTITGMAITMLYVLSAGDKIRAQYTK